LNDFWDFDYADLINKPTFGNIFNQNLNTTDNVTFANVSADYYFGDGSQLTGIIASAEDYSLIVSVDNITDFPSDISYFVNDFGYYNSTTLPDLNSTGLIINWSVDTSGYITINDVLDFNYYNSTNAPTYINDTFAGNYSTFLTHITWSDVTNGTMAKMSDLVNYNSTGLIINWSEEIDLSSYTTLSEMLAFNYYNSTNFNINDYATLSTLNNGTYNYNWNSTGLIINWSGDYLTEETDPIFSTQNTTIWEAINGKLNLATLLGFGYYNATSFSIADYVLGSNLVSLVGNWSADKSSYSTKAEADLLYATIDEPLWTANFTAYNSSWSLDTDTTYSHLSNFTDDLEDRGYTHLTNFTNDLDFAELSTILEFDYWNTTYYGGIGNFTAWDKDYGDLINKPTIPTAVSELTNDFGYYNSTTLPESDYDDAWINETFYNKTQSDDRYLQSYTETDPKWTGNSTLVPYLASNNKFTANQNMTGNNATNVGCIIFSNGGSWCGI
jgi:hypothetical protein